MGTPGYMAPEQATGVEVDARADVYAIGSILYTLLSGTRPYGNTSEQDTLKRVVLGPPTPIDELVSGLAPDLIAIVGKSMARDPAGRYANAAELSADLKRFQAGQLVAAHSYRLHERIVRVVRRHRAAFAIAAAAVAVLAMAAVIGVRRIVAERDEARSARAIANEAQMRERSRADELTLDHARDLVMRDPTRALDVLTTLSPAFTRWGAARTIAADALAREPSRVLRAEAALLTPLLFTPDGASLVAATDSDSVQRWNVASGAPRHLRGHAGRIYKIALGPDGTTLVSASVDRTVRIWNLASGGSRVLRAVEGMTRDLQVSEDGKRLLVALAPAETRIYALDSDALLASIAGSAMFVPGRDDLLSIRRDNVLRLGEREIVTLPAGWWTPAPGLASHRYVYVSGNQGRAAIVDLEAKTATFRDMAASIAFSPDQTRVAFGDIDGAIVIRTLADGSERSLRGHEVGRVTQLDWAPDGSEIASGDASGNVRIWTPATGAWRDLRGHDGSISGLSYSPDGSQLASASFDGTVRIWTTKSTQHELVVPRARRAAILGFNRSGTSVVLVADGKSEVLDVTTGRSRALPVDTANTFYMAVAPDGRHGVVITDEHAIALIDIVAGTRRELPAKSPASEVTWTADSREFATGHADGSVLVWSLADTPPRALARAPMMVIGLSYSPDGKRIAGTDSDGQISVWDVATGETRVVGRHRIGVEFLGRDSLRWSPSGAWLASVSGDPAIGLWHGERDRFELVPRDGHCGGVAFSPDGNQVASCCGAKGIQIRDLARGVDRMLTGHRDGCGSLVWSADARRLAATIGDSTLSVWDVASEEVRFVRGTRWHLDGGGAIFLPEQQAIIGVGRSEVVKARDDLPVEPAALRAAIGREAAARMPR